LLVSFLLAVALLTYDPRDPSLNTAVDAAPRNFLGHSGALVAGYYGKAWALLPFDPAGAVRLCFRLFSKPPTQVDLASQGRAASG
jgi:hypothetical protein